LNFCHAFCFPFFFAQRKIAPIYLPNLKSLFEANSAMYITPRVFGFQGILLVMNNESELPPTILVIFGITGDLSHRYLLPALKKVDLAKKLHNDFKIIGVSRREISTEDLFRENEQGLEKYTEVLQMDLENPKSYEKLKQKIERLSAEFTVTPEIIYYLSVPPAGVLQIISSLGEGGLNSRNTKLLLEKPFGVDLESAEELIAQTHKHFPEKQVYRIDHYLAKEMAQNIVVFLGSNTLFRGVWNNQFIEKIEIDASEKISIEGRANFYDSTGALRDLVQSHLLQLAALTLMEPCSNIFDFEEIPLRRLKALQALKLKTESTVRAQYEGYENEVNNPGSATETFVSLIVGSTSSRWEGVPIRLTTGKNLKEKLTQICVHFKKTEATEENLLILRIQPNEAIVIQLWVKQPGYERKLQKIPHEFTYDKHFDNLPDAYEQVLVDAMQSNHSLFASSDEVLESWRILQPVQSKWEMGSDDLIKYQPGSTINEILENK
jgi:glucose-6-phosphate 1-dehydrogenase